jgi:preprotein translocase SecE subunit
MEKQAKKMSVFGKTHKFYREVVKEVKQVVWPTLRETRMTTIVVCIFAFIVSLYLLCVDKFVVLVLQTIKSL